MSSRREARKRRFELQRMAPDEALPVADRIRSAGSEMVITAPPEASASPVQEQLPGMVIDLRERNAPLAPKPRSEIFREPTIREAIPPSGTGYSIPPPTKALGRPRGHRIQRFLRKF